jgi:hypothetical protein
VFISDLLSLVRPASIQVPHGSFIRMCHLLVNVVAKGGLANELDSKLLLMAFSKRHGDVFR